MGKPNARSVSSESKLDLKFEKKEQFYAKVKYTVASLAAQKSIAKKSIAKKKSKQQRRQEKKLKAYSLSSLLETLPELKEQLKAQPKPQEANFKLNCKNRLEEGKNLSEIFKNHSFQTNPLAAIHQHLRNQQPVPVVEEQQPKKKANVNGSRRRKMKKARTGVQSMDI